MRWENGHELQIGKELARGGCGLFESTTSEEAEGNHDKY
jgi:hypothetical protein